MYKLNKEFRLSKEDSDFLKSLPDNLPQTKLTQKQKDNISSLYYKYIGKTVDNRDWSKNLDDMEKSEKWPTGPRVKTHEAQRIVLGFIIDLPIQMTNKKAAQHYASLCYSRQSFIRLNKYLYSAVK